jgi:hypothetical protein
MKRWQSILIRNREPDVLTMVRDVCSCMVHVVCLCVGAVIPSIIIHYSGTITFYRALFRRQVV